LEIKDVTGNWDMGWNHWNQQKGCWNGCGDWAHLDVTQWTDSRIVIGGLTDAYGSLGWNLNPGDKLRISVWNTSDSWMQNAYGADASSDATVVSS
jgi:hypothetical protein